MPMSRFKDGKTFSQAMTGEVGQDIEQRIKWVIGEGAKQIQRLQATQNTIRGQLSETQTLLKECDARLKWNEQEATKLL